MLGEHKRDCRNMNGCSNGRRDCANESCHEEKWQGVHGSPSGAPVGGRVLRTYGMTALTPFRLTGEAERAWRY
jgi:hypothetical protein